jgi:hypothetical protein
LASNLSNFVIAKLLVIAIDDKLCLTLKSLGYVIDFSAFYGVCCLATPAETFL